MDRAFLRRPVPLALLIALAAWALFLFHLGYPTKTYFDEVHYVPAARTLMALSGPANIEHPLFAKAWIAAGIALFGDDAIGWRFFSTVAAAAVVLSVFAIAFQLTHRTRTAAIAAVLTIANFTVFIQARIAMLDGYMAAFVVGGVAAFLWSMRAPRRWVVARLVLAAALIGMGIGCKWVALPFLGYLGLAVVAIRLRDARVAGRDRESALYASGQWHWRGLGTLPALLILGVVAIGVYLATFLPAFLYAHDALTLKTLLPWQLTMYHEQTEILAPHPYQSAWYSWPLVIRPIWYLYERADGAQRGVLMLGNPVVMWGGLVAVLACLSEWYVERVPALLVAPLLWIGAYGMWALIPKSLGFYYYYYLPSIFLCVAIAVALDHFEARRRRYWDDWFVILAVGVFAYFYPIIAAVPLSGAQAFRHWMWFSTWP